MRRHREAPIFPQSAEMKKGAALSALILGSLLLNGEATEYAAGPDWPENQLAESGFINADVTSVLTIFPEANGCEPSHAVGAKFTAIDSRLGRHAVSGVICLLPGEELGQIYTFDEP